MNWKETLGLFLIGTIGAATAGGLAVVAMGFTESGPAHPVFGFLTAWAGSLIGAAIGVALARD